eukprot:scaffold6982_cov449-Prasinococcus_capsulatus_cf.AAC.4
MAALGRAHTKQVTWNKCSREQCIRSISKCVSAPWGTMPTTTPMHSCLTADCGLSVAATAAMGAAVRRVPDTASIGAREPVHRRERRRSSR